MSKLKLNMKPIFMMLVILTSVWSYRAEAILTIEITEGVDGALPIAVLPFAWQGEGAMPEDVAAIVSADLQRSGRFAPLAREQYEMPSNPQDFDLWKSRGIDYLVIGKLISSKPGQYTVQFRLFDVIKGQQIYGQSMTAGSRYVRKLAHRISDIVFEELIGVRGAFDTRIAYVTAHQDKQEKSYTLAVADADGYNEQIILTSKKPLMSPSWSPDGKFLTYVSFERDRPEVYIQHVARGTRTKVAEYSGLNNAPAWSPAGDRLALTLSRDGNAEIYVLHLSSKKLHRITQHYAIDTEPTWAPNGKSLVFTSDRGGRPQLYQVALDGKGRKISAPKRISFNGRYNSRASFSKDGQSLTFVHGNNGKFNIAIMDMQRGGMQIVADTRLGESPSFSPNGMMVIYAAEKGGKGVLEAVSVDGRARQRLGLQSGDVREPAWSPYLTE
jgi:TolB protein